VIGELKRETDRVEELSLEKAASHLLEECRMVLPGIQALFGFQLIAVFNQSFGEKLSTVEQILHLVAIGLTTVSIALVLAPAACHRQNEPKEVSDGFLRLSSRLLLWSMIPMALSIALDVYLISRIVLGHSLVSCVPAALVLFVFFLFWYCLPLYCQRCMPAETSKVIVKSASAE
jgi:hypothetical protein